MVHTQTKGRCFIKRFRETERYIVLSSRFLTLIAVFGSLASSVLMFILGLYDIYMAFKIGLFIQMKLPDSQSPGALAVINVIEGLDRFLIAIVLLFFAYGVYSLFIRPEQTFREEREELALPSWLRVKEIGQLKQVVAEVIIVILFVLFLRVSLQVFQDGDLTIGWQQIATLLIIPVCTLFLALALRLVELHPKPTRPVMDAEDLRDGGQPPDR